MILRTFPTTTSLIFGDMPPVPTFISDFIHSTNSHRRRAAIDVYCKRSATQGESAEMTFEQLQKQVGIGVNID